MEAAQEDCLLATVLHRKNLEVKQWTGADRGITSSQVASRLTLSENVTTDKVRYADGNKAVSISEGQM